MPLPIEQSMRLHASAEVAAREFSDKRRASLTKKGKAMPGGRYPIVNKEDLGNAKRAIGRAKNPAKTRAWINKRAKELGEPGLGAGGPGSGRHPEAGTFNKQSNSSSNKAFYLGTHGTRVTHDTVNHRVTENGKLKHEGTTDSAGRFLQKRYGIQAGGPGSGRHPEGGKKLDKLSPYQRALHPYLTKKEGYRFTHVDEHGQSHYQHSDGRRAVVEKSGAVTTLYNPASKV